MGGLAAYASLHTDNKDHSEWLLDVCVSTLHCCFFVYHSRFLVLWAAAAAVVVGAVVWEGGYGDVPRELCEVQVWAGTRTFLIPQWRRGLPYSAASVPRCHHHHE